MQQSHLIVLSGIPDFSYPYLPLYTYVIRGVGEIDRETYLFRYLPLLSRGKPYTRILFFLIFADGLLVFLGHI